MVGQPRQHKQDILTVEVIKSAKDSNVLREAFGEASFAEPRRQLLPHREAANLRRGSGAPIHKPGKIGSHNRERRSCGTVVVPALVLRAPRDAVLISFTLSGFEVAARFVPGCKMPVMFRASYRIPGGRYWSAQ